jgi:membrane protein DedA with SNARE-associated domain
VVLAFRFFFVIGPALAVWAVVLAVIGFTRPEFPEKIAAQRVVIAISALLVAGVIASAVINAKFEKPETPKTGPAAHERRGNGE